jgi:hypothetical protein
MAPLAIAAASTIGLPPTTPLGRPALDLLTEAGRMGNEGVPGMCKRVTLMVLLLASLAGTGIGVTAQSQDVERVGFTGSLHEVAAADDCGRGATREMVDGVWQTRGYCYQQWLGATDPRFTGTLTRAGNTDEYVEGDFLPDGDVSLWVSTVTHLLENEGGTWRGDATVSVTVADVREGGEVDISPQAVVFTGSGDYEGLTAVVWWQPPVINSPVRGIIFPGSPPPPSPAE